MTAIIRSRGVAVLLTGLVALATLVTMAADSTLRITRPATQDARTVVRAAVGQPPSAGVYRPLTAPARILDTRSGLGESAARPLRGHSSIVVRAGGRAGLPVYGLGSLLGTLTVHTPGSSGQLIAYDGGARPATASLMFTRNRTASVTVLVSVTDGRLTLASSADGPVDVTLDVEGYYGAGTVPVQPGLFHPIAPQRVVDTRTGAGGNRRSALSDGDEFAARLAGQGAVPSTDVGAVAVVVHAVSPTSAGSLSLWSPDTVKPPLAALHYSAGENTSAFDVVALGASADAEVYAANTGRVDVVIDVVGYFGYGASAPAGGYQAATSSIQVYGPRTLGPDASTQIDVSGRAAVPRAHVRAVVVAVQGFRSTAAGRLTLRAAGAIDSRNPMSLPFTAGAPASDVFVVPVSTSGAFTVHNVSRGPTTASIALLGYLPDDSVDAPSASVGRYVRNLDGNDAHDRRVMAAEGAADGRARRRIVLLAIGAQANDESGVVLSITHTLIPWATVTRALDSYLAAYARHSRAAPVKIVLATSNSGSDWTHYPATKRGSDWARRVVDAVHVPARSAITVAAGVDFESGFTSTEAQAQQWEDAYLAATPRDLVYTGDATDCPIVFSAVVRPCAFGWTQSQIYALAHHGRRITVLPQIYAPDDALKWANIDVVGGGQMIFDGVLTEHSADPARSQEPSHGWVALQRALSWTTEHPSLPSVVDLQRNET